MSLCVDARGCRNEYGGGGIGACRRSMPKGYAEGLEKGSCFGVRGSMLGGGSATLSASGYCGSSMRVG